MNRKFPAALTALSAILFFLAVPASADDGSEETWKVNNENVPHTDLRFSTNEGTWMNLDISPDGSEIVFDLLGDIYIMPIAGGEARALSRGISFDIQPRFSPDGSKISFTTDEGGGDNIWIMDRDGSNRRAVSSESFRLLNNGYWTPDGEYLVGRKHFTSQRSLGAGEMWLYHITGGSGIQLTERKNDQQDAGQPTVSHDGRYVYFSEDFSGGSTFEYNKDPHGQIYVVRRYDMETGELSTIISGPGGAISPMESPDGRYISFIRRVRFKTVLYIHDTETGEQWPVFDGLSHDQQEAWAIFGPYPNYQWTPDSEAIVIWAKGKIMRVSVAEASAEEIPFTAPVDMRIAETVTATVNPLPEQFEAKMLRQVVTHPSGDYLVFVSNGSLYSSPLPQGDPQRLTDDDRFEYYPAFNPDGTKMVYIAWDDQQLASIMEMDMASGERRRLNDVPGYYYEPSYSADGDWIVYRRGGGSWILGGVHGTEPGLYVMRSDGGEARKVIDSGNSPFFGPQGERIYYHTGFTGNHALQSVNLRGEDMRTHFTSNYANTYAVSPDFRWIAFIELHKAYVAPFPKTGKAIDLTSKSSSYPVTEVAGDAGWFLHWSGDSSTLHWTLGNEYFSRPLTESFSYIENGAAEIAPPAENGMKIGLELRADAPEGTIAFTGARLITMDQDGIIENGTIVVTGNRIVAQGTTGDVEIPEGAKIYDVSGKTILPGLIDSHAHAAYSGGPIVPQENWQMYANLAFGVTTLHDPSSDTETTFYASEMQKAGRIVAPRIFSTGTILYGAEYDQKAVVNNYEDALGHLRRLQAVGAFSVKSYNQPRRDQRQQIIKAGRELGMLIVPEGGSTFYHNINQIIDGHTTIEHNLPIAPLYNDILTLAENAGTAYNPTLVVCYGGLSGEYYWYEHTNVWENERLLTFHPRRSLDARSIRRQKAPEEDYFHIEVARSLKDLNERGAMVLIGAHGQRQGIAAHWEIWMQVQGGMSEMDALRSATINGARWMGMDAHLGSLKPGKLADLVVLDENPLENIRNTETVAYTMINGRLFDARTMDQLGNQPAKRGSFWWERGPNVGTFPWHEENSSYGTPHCGCGRH